MNEHDFESTVLRQLGSIEAKQNAMYDELRTHQEDIKDLKEMATKALESAKAAHHRINALYVVGGLVASIIAYFLALLQQH